MNLLDLFESAHGGDCHLCKGTGEGLFDGESCPVCDGTGIEPRSRNDDDVYDTDDYDDADYGDEESYYEKSLRNRGLGEGAGDIGAQIKAAYQKIYNQGDDAVEFMYYDSPIFAQYWDEYEGDLDSIIAEVDPSELQIILDELTSAAEEQGVAEAAKKKDDDRESEIKDVSLNRAITRAKADFPTAGSGIEALAKDFMRSQEQDQTAFSQLRQAERKQDQMLSQISKIDQEQEQEIQSLDNQNSTLAKRLQQLQSVNSELEKKLAAMSGRKEKRKGATSSGSSSTTVPTATAAASTTEPDTITPEPTASPVIGRMAQDLTAEPSKSKALGQMAKTLAPPAPSAAIDQMTQQLQPRQKELGFDEPTVLEPNIKSGRRINTSKAVDAPYRDVSVKMAKKLATDPAMRNQMYNADALRNLAGQEEMPLENKEPKPERPEADYGDEYQSMVKRVGQKAKKQEQSKSVDVANLARRLAAIEASHKDSK